MVALLIVQKSFFGMLRMMGMRDTRIKVLKTALVLLAFSYLFRTLLTVAGIFVYNHQEKVWTVTTTFMTTFFIVLCE
jgi:hypothetical protein